MSGRLRWTLLLALLLPGCTRQKPAAVVESVTGNIVKIDERSRVVTIEFQRQQDSGRGRLEAIVPHEAEILINGVTATLEQLRIGEKVTGYGTVERRHGAAIITALKVYAERQAITPVATKPAGEPPSGSAP